MRKIIFAVTIGTILIIGVGLVEGPPSKGTNCACQPSAHYRDEQSLVSSLSGAIKIAFHLTTPWLRDYRSIWGANEFDRHQSLPGDERGKEPNWSYTRAITIAAPRAEVWGWIAQLGQKRGGFYSYQGLENLLSCRITNAEVVNPDWQIKRAGEEFYLHPQSPPLNVAAIRSGYWFLLRAGSDDKSGPVQNDGIDYSLTWLFYLREVDADTTRLVVRGNYYYSDNILASISYGPALVEPIAYVMERKLLEGIKRRAERPDSAD